MSPVVRAAVALYELCSALLDLALLSQTVPSAPRGSERELQTRSGGHLNQAALTQVSDRCYHLLKCTTKPLAIKRATGPATTTGTGAADLCRDGFRQRNHSENDIDLDDGYSSPLRASQ